MDNKKIGSFTGLRFIMIMLIVMAHFEFLQGLPLLGTFYTKYLHNPTMAVDFFFLLSGFGMMISSIKKINSNEMTMPTFLNCIKYGIKHVKKIYPIYIFTIFFGFCFKIIFLIYESNVRTSTLITEFTKLIVNIFLLQSATSMKFFTHAFNGVSWFLSTLFCIYLLAPLCIFILRKVSKSIFIDITFFIINIFLVICLSFIYEKIEAKIHIIDYLNYGSPYKRLIYVLIGMNIALIFQRARKYFDNYPETQMSILESIICIISIVYFFLRNSMPSGKYKYLIDIIVCSAFLFIFAFDKGYISKILQRDKFQKLGNMSMYIFLIHYPIRVYFGAIISNVFGWTWISCVLFLIFILLSTFTISYIIFRIQNKWNKDVFYELSNRMETLND